MHWRWTAFHSNSQWHSIGVNTGPAIIGNFGGDLRFDYTSIGDTVNTAARLEGANKYFGTRLCVSGATLDASDGVRARKIGDIILKGKSEGLPVWQPLSDDDPALDTLDSYNAAYDLLARKDPAAMQAFMTLAQDSPDDALVRFHLDRLHNSQLGTKIALDEK